MVPNGWEIQRLEQVVSNTRKITYGIVVPGPHEPTGNLMIRAQDYSRGWVDSNDIYRVSDAVHESYKRSQVKEFDVLLTIVGSIGNTAIVPNHLDGANLTQQTARLAFEKHDPNFFYSVISSSIGKKEIYRYAKSGVQPSLNLSDVAKFKVPVPPLPEQRKIAKILLTWDKAIATTEKLIETSKQQKKALMQQLLTGKKRLVNPETGMMFEGDWEEVKLGELGTVVSGGTPSTSLAEYWDGDIDWVTPTDITKLRTRTIRKTSRKITKLGLQNSSAKLVPAQSLLICTRATIGELAITEHKMCTNQGFKNVIPTKYTNVEFLYYLIQSVKHRLIAKASGSTFLELSKKDFENIRLHVPVFEEQQKIASVLTVADKEIEVLEAKLAHFNQEKKALMQQLLTGKRRVKVEEMEAA